VVHQPFEGFEPLITLSKCRTAGIALMRAGRSR